MLRRAGGGIPGSDLGTARFETFLRRLFGVKGIVAPAIEPKLQAGVDLLTRPWELAENAILMGWRGYEAYTNNAAVAGQFAHMQLLNPVGSGLLVVVERFYTANLPAALTAWYELGTWNAGLTQRTAIMRIDGRGPTPLAPVSSTGATVWSGSTVASSIGGSAALHQAATGQRQEVHGPWVVQPGFAFMMVATAVNVALLGGIRWWERAAEPSELAAS